MTEWITPSIEELDICMTRSGNTKNAAEGEEYIMKNGKIKYGNSEPTIPDEPEES